MLGVSLSLLHANPCHVLGLREGQHYTAAELRRAFYQKAKVLHPDVGGSAAGFRALCDAYLALRSEHGYGVSRQPPTTGFYDGVHARWDSASAARQAEYWRAQYVRHEARYGEGLGADFARDSGWDYAHARWRSTQGQRHATNFSSWYFYRPYVSSFDDPYGHGFTAAELQQAASRTRRALFRTVLKYVVLLGGVLVVVMQHHRTDRVRRAVAARSEGYHDAAYWAAVQEYEAAHSPPRLERHWLDAPLPSQGHTDIDTALPSQQTSALADAAPASSPPPPPRRLRQAARGDGADGGVLVPRSVPITGPVAVRFQGRPFTSTGVRGGRGTMSKTTRTYIIDVTHDMDFDVDDEEA